MSDLRDLFFEYGYGYLDDEIARVVKKYIQDYEVEKEVELTEAEIHAERSKKYIQGNHIVCPFEYEGSEEVEEMNTFDFGEDDELADGSIRGTVDYIADRPITRGYSDYGVYFNDRTI